MRALVIDSDNARCPRGSDAMIDLAQGFGGVPDTVSIRPAAESNCAILERWTSTNRQRVDVHIAGPHQTP